MSGNAPERIWADPPEIFDGMDVWRSEPGGKGVPYILATPEALAASPEVQALIAAEREAQLELLSNALRALVSARDTLQKRMGTSNRFRDQVISDLSAALGVEVVPAKEAAP